jgi:hypothetical protein
MPKTTKCDWETIEQEYRAGQLSIREIARQHGATESNIRRRAKAHGWERDLTEKVRKSVRSKVMRSEVRTPNASDKEIIEANAERGAQALLIMRKDIAALREVEQNLLDELNGEPTKLWIGQYQGQIVEKEVGLTVAERAAAAANLAQVQHKRIALERQALNLDECKVSLEEILDALPEEFAIAVRKTLAGSIS